MGAASKTYSQTFMIEKNLRFVIKKVSYFRFTDLFIGFKVKK